MNNLQIITRATGILTSLALMTLAVFWGEDPYAGSCTLFFGGILILVGSVKSVVNREAKIEINVIA